MVYAPQPDNNDDFDDDDDEVLFWHPQNMTKRELRKAEMMDLAKEIAKSNQKVMEFNFPGGIGRGILGIGKGLTNAFNWFKGLFTSRSVVRVGVQALETVAPRTISSMSPHSINQAITRGFKSSDILKIVKEGTATMGRSRFGNAQWRYMLNGNTVIVDATKNRVITVFSNAPGTANKLGAGYINPFR